MITTRGRVNFATTNNDGVLLSDDDRLDNVLHGREHFDDVSERSVRLFANRFLGHAVFHQGKI